MTIGENDDQPMDLYEKYESQWEGLSHILWKIKNVPNHQPVYI